MSIYAQAGGKVTGTMSLANEISLTEQVSGGLDTPFGGAKATFAAKQSATQQLAMQTEAGVGSKGEESWNTSASVQIKDSDQIERSMNKTETFGHNTSLMVNGQEIDKASIQEALEQRISESQSRIQQLQHSMSTATSDITGTELTIKSFENVHNLYQAENNAVTAVKVLAESNENNHHLRSVALDLEYIVQTGGNVGDFARAIRDMYSNPETKNAALAAIEGFFYEENKGVSNIAGNILNNLTHAEHEIKGVVEDSIKSPIDVMKKVDQNFANNMNVSEEKQKLHNQFEQNPLTKNASNTIEQAKENLHNEQDKDYQATQQALNVRENKTNVTAMELMAKDVSADKQDHLNNMQNAMKNGNYGDAIKNALSIATPGGTSSYFGTANPTVIPQHNNAAPENPHLMHAVGNSSNDGHIVKTGGSGNLQANGQSENHQADNQPQETAIPAENQVSGSLNGEKHSEVADKDAHKEPQNEQEKPAKPHKTRQAEHLSQENNHQNQGDNKKSQPTTQKSDSINGVLGSVNKPVAFRRISWREIREPERQFERQFDCSNPIERHESLKVSHFCSELKNASYEMIKQKGSYENAAKYVYDFKKPWEFHGNEQRFLNKGNDDYHYSLGQCYGNKKADIQYTVVGWVMNANPAGQSTNIADHAYAGFSIFGRGIANTINAFGHLKDKGKFDDKFFKLAFNTNVHDPNNIRGLRIGKEAGKNYGYKFDKFVEDLCGNGK